MNTTDIFIGLAEWLFKRDAKFMSFITRDVMENANSYEEARQSLSTEKLIAPGYYILGGNKTGQACVITRNRKDAADVWDMDNKMWYMVETNYDHWKKPMFLDDRRTPAKHCLDQLTQKVSSFLIYVCLC